MINRLSRNQIVMVCALGATFLLTGRHGLAQSFTASLFGTVTDSTGAGVPNAGIVAVNITNNTRMEARSDSAVKYQVLGLAPGVYTVEVSASGFKKFVRSGIVLEVNRNARVDPTLEAGAVTETVSVTSDAPLVETNTTTLGQTTTNAEIVNLPLVNRDLYTLLELTAGVDSTQEPVGNAQSCLPVPASTQ